MPDTIRNFFTDAEWDAISSAMADFADYGTEESDLADEIQAKIARLFATV